MRANNKSAMVDMLFICGVRCYADTVEKQNTWIDTNDVIVFKTVQVIKSATAAQQMFN